MSEIRFQFTPTKEDYIRSYRTFLMSNPRTLWGIGLMFAIETIVFIAALDAPNMATRWDSFLVIIVPGILPIVLVVSLVLAPRRVGRQVVQNENLRSLVSWQVDDEQILIESALATTKLNWGVFQKAIETDRLFFLVYATNRGMYQFVPKRAFESAQQVSAFRELLERKLSTLQTSSGETFWVVPLLVRVALALLALSGFIAIPLLLWKFMEGAR